MLSYTRSHLFRSYIQDYYDETLELIKTASDFTIESNLSNEDLERIYSHGYYLFASGLLESAKHVFYALTKRAPANESYWRALGVTHYGLKNYAKALNALEEALKLDPNSICHVYHAELLLITGKNQAGLDELRAFIGEHTPTFSKDLLHIRAQIILQRNAPKM